jgi:hypothetical protein
MMGRVFAEKVAEKYTFGSDSATGTFDSGSFRESPSRDLLGKTRLR